MRYLIALAGTGSISRRYFVMNSFDGAMTVLGIIMGSWAARAVDPRVVVGTGFGAAVAMAISGFTGAAMTERAERLRRLRSIEKAMLTSMKGSIHERSMKVATIWIAFIDGISPLLVALVGIIPFLLALEKLIDVDSAVAVSISLIMALLFLLGAFLGRISSQNMLLSGLRMIGAGCVTALILGLLGLG
jgi:predicted membrane protein (TIGR00267 family)